MNSNSKRQTNRLQFAALMRGVIAIAFLGAAGLSYVYLRNQLDVCGNHRKALEQELNELVSENNVLETQIAGLKTHTALQRRIDEGFIKLVRINIQSLVRLHTQEGSRWVADDRAGADQLQTVSHERASRQ